MDNQSFRIGIDARLWNETGVGRYIRNLVDGLSVVDKKNHYYLYVKKREFEEIQLPNINFHKRLADIHWHSIREQVLLPKIFLRDQLDLMHFPYFSYPLFYHKPFVLTIHDLILNHFPTGKASTLPGWLYQIKYMSYQFLLQNGAQKAKKIITVSQATKKEIIEHLGVSSDKVVVTYEGVDVHFSSRNHNGISQGSKKYFLYVGNAYPHKNVQVLLKAFSRYYKKNRFIQLVLVGKKDFFYNRVLQECKKLNLSDAVVFYTDVTDEMLTYLYQHAIALILPSFMEGFGLPALEAMSQKCLVIASAIPAFQEICQNAALYFDPHNELELEQTLIEATMQRDKMLPIITKGIERVKQFSWEKTAAETVTIYESSIRL